MFAYTIKRDDTVNDVMALFRVNDVMTLIT